MCLVRKKKGKSKVLTLFRSRAEGIAIVAYLLLTPSESLLHWFRGNFEAMFVLNDCWREFLCLHSLITLNRGVKQSN